MINTTMKLLCSLTYLSFHMRRHELYFAIQTSLVIRMQDNWDWGLWISYKPFYQCHNVTDQLWNSSYLFIYVFSFSFSFFGWGVVVVLSEYLISFDF